MSDHNNIYNIMSKLDALKPAPETPKQAAERIYESVEAKGSILEGVKTVEQTLSEKYMGFKAVEKSAKKGGAENPAAVAVAVGRKKYGKAAFQKAAAAGKKMGESQLDEGIMDSLKGVVAKLQALPMIQKNLAAAKAKLPQIIAAAQKSQSGKDLMANLGIDKQQAQVAEGLGKTIAWGSYAGAGASLIAIVADFAMRAYISMGKPSFEEMSSYQASGFLLLASFAAVGAGAIALGTSKALDSMKKDDMDEDRETLKTKHGTIYKGGTYGTDFDGDDAPKKPKHVPKTGQKGRPKKEKPAEYSKTNDPFGRVPDKAPKGKKGTVIKGKGNQDTVDEGCKTVGTMVLESVNFKKMMDECDMTMAEMLECINQDIQSYKTTGDMTDRLRDFMHLHNHAKKQMEENKPVPYEVPAVQRRAAGAAPLTPGDVQAQDAARSMHPGMTKLDAPAPAVNDELDELAKLAGITDEGNAFTGKLASTPKGGEFELDGKTFKDTSSLDEAMCNECGMYESQCSCHEGNLFTKHLKDTPDGGEFEIDGKKYRDTSSLEEMARLAGIFQEGKDYGDTTYNEPPTYDNTPDEQVQDEDVLLRGGDGEVAGMEKKMNRDGAARFSDNPLAMKESQELIKPAAEFDYVEAMGRKLMQAYEGIKAKWR